MSRSVVYRESDSREWEETNPRRSYTTVKRYKVPESVSVVSGEEETTKEKITIRRQRSAQPRERERDSEDINIRITERDRGGGDDRRFSERLNVSDSYRDSGRDRGSSYRVVEKESDFEDRRSRVDYRSSDQRSSFVERDTREVVRDSSPQERVREYRFERDRDFSPSRHRRDDSYEVEHYVKETDYYAPERPPPIIIREKSREPPQPIIIQEAAPQPIIIREGRREPRYEFVEERDESKSVVKSERSEHRSEHPPPSPSVRSMHTTKQEQPQQQQQDENYFYERRVIERDRLPPSRHRDSYELHPRDSASNYSSDDSYEKVRKSTTYYEDRDHSPHHKRHLAEGALVGAAAGEILRHHRLSQGQRSSGRIVSGVGGAAVGALGAEAISRFRSRSRRRRSMSRSSDESRHSRRSHHRGRHHSPSRSRSRSRSRSKSLSGRRLAGYAGVAALGALGAYALTRGKKNNETVIINDGGRRRSRSNRRSLSADGIREDDKHRDPQHRNRRIAQAGLASAAAAGLIERVRSKSRGGRNKSKSRLHQAIPVAAAGLGGAALAGLYEKNQANKEAKRDAIIADEMHRGRRPSRSRSRSAVGRRGFDQGYGYGSGNYSDEEEPPHYRRNVRGESGSPDIRNRRRSHSRNKHMAEGLAAGGAAGAAAYGLGRHEGTENREYQEYGDPWHGHGGGNQQNQYNEPPSGYIAQSPQPGYPAQPQPYSNNTYFPPPPTGEHANPYAYSPPPNNANPYPAYNPAEWAQGGAPGPQATRDINEHDAGAAAANGAAAYPEQPPPAADDGRRGRGGANDVSDYRGSYNRNGNTDGERDLTRNDTQPHAATVVDAGHDENDGNNNGGGDDADGVRTPRARSSSRVRFNLGANRTYTDNTPRKTEERYSDSETRGDRKRRHRHRRNRRHGEGHSHGHGHGHGDDDNDSDDTIELPERFDEHGNRKGEGADAFQTLLGTLTSRFLGGEGGGDGGSEGRNGRRRYRH